ncbi:Flp family type IVb pilin [Rhodoplanes sp. TEM]|uniref:Flp family type IVb pilin n=1 Tax=Rhodoplanes tepidamans TaxID=200616 RepID=A0ABT5JAC7_RHOTP|nr:MULTISPECIES: Flp family type IVb pilin [Rhodoplanes]MDC7786551.1 Flp family type IVb pilin [Rhodoplanes tepidamans]MDC7983111.1 Flp family type IVb pilin [Rhodoplanes sp. TEM]MDQ0357569.1 pilus assembly protein Flp/PilA [Rhodoplanes tepidamans]
MSGLFIRFLDDLRAATAIEYGLMAGLIALAIIAAVGTTGEQLLAALHVLLDYFVSLGF